MIYYLQLICIGLNVEYIVVWKGTEKEWDVSRLFCG